jgi:YD repeat-containing protein
MHIKDEYTYDAATDMLATYSFNVGTGLFQNSISYIYDAKDRVQSITNSINNEKEIYTYDGLSRISTKAVLIGNEEKISYEYEYLQKDESSSSLVKEVITRTNGVIDNITNYDYDERGNITKIENDEGIIRYEYDVLNRLTREDNSFFNKSYSYKYDNGGNILYKKEYAYSLEEELTGTNTRHSYSYENNGWRDQLISYDGEVTGN